MPTTTRPRRRATIVLAAIALAAASTYFAATAPQSGALEPDTDLPLVPRTDTPRILDGTVVDQAVVDGTVFVAGTFTRVETPQGQPVDAAFFLAYDLETGQVDAALSPRFDDEVLAVEPDGHGGLIVGGKFNSIDGQPARKLARLSGDGTLDPSFEVRTSAKVTAIAVRGNRVYVGGPFTSVMGAGVWKERSSLAAFKLPDGSIQNSFDLPITTALGRGADLSVKAMDFAGDQLVVAHTGREVAGQTRIGAAIIDLSDPASPSLSAWRTRFYETNTIDVGGQLAITDMAVSPDGSYFVIVSSGGDRPTEGKDSAVRFPVAGLDDVQPDWISRHFDSLFGVAISERAVFTGGHFRYQEAPGSPDPFPGDPDVNYGAGAAGLGAAILGNQVVSRDQLAALDPVTGKSLGWNPGSDAEIGVSSIEVIDRGLLVGHDGNIVGDKFVGRHALFDIERDVPPAVGLTTHIDSHFSGEVVDAGSVTLGGFATDGQAGVERVQLAILELSSKRWVQPDGSLDAGWAGLESVLTQPGQAQTRWSLDLGIDTPGDYQVQAKTFTVDGRKDPAPHVIEIRVRPADDALPSVVIDPPPPVTSRTVAIGGTATDDRGVRRVTVTVRDSRSNEYLQDDGSLIANAPNSFVADLGAVDAPETSWSFTFTVPRNGVFKVDANVIDTGGQDDGKFQQRNITIAPGDDPPTLTLPEGAFEIATDTSLTFTATATDDLGLDVLRVSIRHQLTGAGTRPDNTFGANGTGVNIPVGDPLSTTFTYTSPPLPTGTYQLAVRARDELLQTTQVTRTIRVGPIGDSTPTVTIDAPRTVYEAPNPIVLTGVASDDISVESINIYVYDFLARRWIDQAGLPVAGLSPIVVSPANPGAASTDWSWTFTPVTESRYRFWATAVDSAGQESAVTGASTANHWFMPNDALPTVGRISPADDAELTGGRIFVTGRAEDDNLIRWVQVRIRREADRKWLRADGTYGSSQWMAATLTNPGRPGTNWDFATPMLNNGRYRVEIRTSDDTARVVNEVFFVDVSG